MSIENDIYFQKKLEKRNNSRISIEKIVDSVAQDFVLYNSCMLLETIKENITIEELNSNPFFKNIYLYLSKQNFNYEYYTSTNKININIPWNDISNDVNFINFDIILYTLKKLPNQLRPHIDEYINEVEKYIKEYKQQNFLTKFLIQKPAVSSVPDSYGGITNPDGTYTINKTTYKDKEVYMRFLTDDNVDNYVILDGIVYPVGEILKKI